MKSEVISRFREKPKTKTAWKAMWFGLSTLFVGPILGINAAVMRPFFDKNMGEAVGNFITIGIALCAFTLSVSGLIIGVRAFRKGERSWVLWIGFVPAIIVNALWIFMIVGEFAVPHQ